MKKTVVLLLGGLAGTGKTTFADYLNSKKQFDEYAFADELKKETSKLHALPLHFFYDLNKKDVRIGSINKTPRELLIEVAGEMRKSDDECFVKLVSKQISFFGHCSVISDFRYPIEYNYLKGMGFEVYKIWIKRDGVKPINDNGKITENDCDFTIYGHPDEFDGEYMWKQLLQFIQFQ